MRRERVARFVQFVIISLVLNLLMLVLSVTQIAPSAIGPPGGMFVLNLVLNVVLLVAGAGLLWLLR